MRAETGSADGSVNAGDQGTGGAKGRSAKRRRKKRRRKAAQPTANGAAQLNAPADDSNAADAPSPARPEPSQPFAPAQNRTARAGGHLNPDAYAALDLGTNNCRLLVAVPTRPGQFRVVDAFSRIVRLGEGLGHSNRLSDVAMDRAVEALRICKKKLSTRPMRRTRLIATEACRSAVNGERFLERVRAEAGLDLEIVDRQTEARLAVAGCGSLIERGTDAVVLFDIGGGSSEIALIDMAGGQAGKLADKIVAWTSLPVGVVTLAERFGGRDVTPQVFDAMKAAVHRMLADFEGRTALGTRTRADRFHLLGTSGTVTTLAGIHLDLPRYDRRKVDGLWLRSDDLDSINSKLLSWSYAERAGNACIGPERADLVLAGCAILEAIRETWPTERLRVADRGLREGLLTEMMTDDGVWRRGRRRSRQPANQTGR